MVEAKVKKFGNSLGLVLPSKLVKELGIQEGDLLEIKLKKKSNVFKELFGALDFKGKSADELIKEQRKEWESSICRGFV